MQSSGPQGELGQVQAQPAAPAAPAVAPSVPAVAPAAAAPEPVRQYGDPVLRRRARAVRRVNAGIRELARRVTEAMYAARGVGLAAPQIGEPRRLIVVDIGDGPLTLVNPSLVRGEGQETDVEGCLSVKGLVGEVGRFTKVFVRGLALDGKEVIVEGEGLLARTLQHELDHLDGILFVDRAASLTPAERSRDADEEDGGEEDDADRGPVSPDGAGPRPGPAFGGAGGRTRCTA